MTVLSNNAIFRLTTSQTVRPTIAYEIDRAIVPRPDLDLTVESSIDLLDLLFYPIFNRSTLLEAVT